MICQCYEVVPSSQRSVQTQQWRRQEKLIEVVQVSFLMTWNRYLFSRRQTKACSEFTVKTKKQHAQLKNCFHWRHQSGQCNDFFSLTWLKTSINLAPSSRIFTDDSEYIIAGWNKVFTKDFSEAFFEVSAMVFLWELLREIFFFFPRNYIFPWLVCVYPPEQWS